MRVYVLNMRGKPLMPTTPAKAKFLLREGKATVVKREPFTIQLNYATGEAKQPIVLGVDAGSKVIGISASTEEEELYSAEVYLRTDIVDLLATRKANRCSRRGSKTRYREQRSNNRIRGKREGWLSPSINRKIDIHVQAIDDVHAILPVSSIVVEVASFDIRKIKTPDISGEQYQDGEQSGFWNAREYVLWRDGHKCINCKGRTKDPILNVHHIESRKVGGNAPNNLVTLCSTCHKQYHLGNINLSCRRGVSFRDASFMGMMRKCLLTKLSKKYLNVEPTYGYITKNIRILNGIEKTHRNDALCIAKHPNATKSYTWYLRKAVRRHNRQIHKATINKGGYRKLNQSPKYVFGYQLFDMIKTKDGECGFIFGRRLTGYFAIRTLNGTKLFHGISYTRLIPILKRKTILTERHGGCV